MIHSYQNKWRAFLYITGVELILKWNSRNTTLISQSWIYTFKNTRFQRCSWYGSFVLFLCISSLEIKQFILIKLKQFVLIKLLRTRTDTLLSDGMAFISNEVYHYISTRQLLLSIELGVLKNLRFQEIDEKVKNIRTLIDNADFYMQQITGNTLKSLLVNCSLKT